MAKVLLNVTESELNTIGGDFTYYRSMLRLSNDRFSFVTLQRQRPQLTNFLRKMSARLLTRELPERLRRYLILRWYLAPLPPSELQRQQDISAVYSFITFPDLPPSHKLPIIWNTQGIFKSPYYDYFGKISFDDAVWGHRFFGMRAIIMQVCTEIGAKNIRECCGEISAKIVVIPEAVDIAPIGDVRAKPESPVRLIFVGRDPIRKGLPDVLEAFRVLAKENNDLELVVVSRTSGRLRAEILATPKVRYFENIPRVQLHKLLEEAHILVVPTYADTYNLVLVEGMAKGCAIISSNYEPITEVAPDGEVGFLVSLGDVGAIVKAIRILLENRELRQRMGKAGVARYLRLHSLEVFSRKLQALFNEVAK
ncbi:MAG: glycosyltransferase family 4 protein [Candidatus Methanomethyliaceae archaeon]